MVALLESVCTGQVYLPTIIFVAATIANLYHRGVMQVIVKAVAMGMTRERRKQRGERKEERRKESRKAPQR